jgi:hypothetical protein
MENMIHEGQTMSEFVGALTLMIQSLAADRAAFAEAELVATKLMIDAHNFAAREMGEVERSERRMMDLFDKIKYDIADIGGCLLQARSVAKEAAAAVVESEARRDRQRPTLTI